VKREEKNDKSGKHEVQRVKCEKLHHWATMVYVTVCEKMKHPAKNTDTPLLVPFASTIYAGHFNIFVLVKHLQAMAVDSRHQRIRDFEKEYVDGGPN
jgi:hypothetical protein